MAEQDAADDVDLEGWSFSQLLSKRRRGGVARGVPSLYYEIVFEKNVGWFALYV